MKKIICLSYFPTTKLLSSDIINKKPEEIVDHLQQLDPVLPTNCVWVIKDNIISPILIIENAKILYDTTMAWAEGEPSNWFYFGAAHNSKCYTIGLFPNINKSLERFIHHQNILHKQIISKDDNIKIVFHPLGYVSDLSVYIKIKNKIKNKINLGISESIDAAKENEVYWIKNIEKSDKNHKIEYVESYLNEIINNY